MYSLQDLNILNKNNNHQNQQYKIRSTLKNQNVEINQEQIAFQ